MLRTPELQRVCIFLLLPLLRSRGRETRARGDASNLQGAPTAPPPTFPSPAVPGAGGGRRAGLHFCSFPSPFLFLFFQISFFASVRILPAISLPVSWQEGPPLLPPPPFPPSDADERRKASRKKRKLDRSYWRKDFQLCTFRSQLCESPHGLR